MAAGEVAQDGVGFPQHEIAVDDHGHQPVGIAGALGTVIAALPGEAQFLAGPQHLADVDRACLADDAQRHPASPSCLGQSHMALKRPE